MSAASNVIELPKRGRVVYDYALVPDGEYDARIVDDYTAVYFRGAARLVLTWSLCTPGHVGTIVRGYYAVPGLIGRVGRHGRYRAVGRCSRLARDLAAMLGTRPSLLAGPFPRDLVARQLYRVELAAVTHDHEQRDIPTGARYSRVVRVFGSAV